MAQSIGIYRKIVAGILFAIPWIFYMALPLYNRVDPRIGGLTYFYWIQIVWLVITAVLTAIGALLIYPKEE